ncbi:MAG: helix-turn-helix transcriptional regulator [Clostridia bacterium]|nr:helix-turn-helix transcriptional regulator [Clostridia bacterium]
MTDKEKSNIGKKLKKMRTELGLTQDDIAEVLSMNRTTFSKYENGAAVPPVNVLMKLAALFNVPVSVMLNDDNTLRFNSPERDDVDADTGSVSDFTQLNRDEKKLILKLRLMNADKKARIKELIYSDDENNE